MPKKTRGLYKTTIVIWSDQDPSNWSIEDLAHDAMSGDSYCPKETTEHIPYPQGDPGWDGTEFFDLTFEQQDKECRPVSDVGLATHKRKVQELVDQYVASRSPQEEPDILLLGAELVMGSYLANEDLSSKLLHLVMDERGKIHCLEGAGDGI